MKLNLNLKQFEQFKVDNKEYILCQSRLNLIQKLPEELVRQALVREFLDAGINIELIEVEVPISRFKKRAQGRADIIIYANAECTNVAVIIECKAASIPLTDSVFEQAIRYNKVLNASFVCIANNQEFITYQKIGNDYIEVVVGNLSDLFQVGLELPKLEPVIWERVSEEQLNDSLYIKEYTEINTGAPTYPISRFYLDIESSDDIKNLAIRMIDLFYDAAQINKLRNLNCSLAVFKKDLGERFSRYTYFGGEGSFAEFYRHILLMRADNEDYFTISAALYSYDYYNWESEQFHVSSHRGTYLMFGYNYKGNSNHSLEYKLDKHVTIEGPLAHFWHDGAITVVKRRKNKDLISLVHLHKPSLIVNDKIYLGSLPISGPFYMQHERVKNLLSNFIDYILIRELFRSMIRN